VLKYFELYSSTGFMLLLFFSKTFVFFFSVCATCIWVLFFAHIPFMVNHAFSAMPAERLQHQ